MTDVELNAPRGRIRLAIMAFYFAQGLCFASWASRIPDIKSELEITDGTLGSILFAIPIGQLLAMPFSGYIISKYGSINTLVVSLMFYVLILIGIGYSETPMQLSGLLVLFGIAGNFFNISVNTQGVYIEDYYRRPIMGTFHGGWSIAGFCGALFGLLAINLHINPFYHFSGIAVIVLTITILNFRFLFPDIKKSPKVPSQKEKGFKLKKPEKLLILLGIVGFCGMASEGAMFDWSGVYFQDVVQVPKKLVPLGYTAFMIMMATGRFVADKLIIEYGRRRVLQVCGITISTGLFIAVLFPNIIACTLAFMIIGLGVSCVIPIVYSVAGKEAKVPANIALVIVSSISFIGFLIGPPVIGYVAEIANLRYSYALIGIFGICIALLVSNMKVFKK